MTTARRLAWISAAQSHVGTVRELNEDRCLDRPALGNAGLWVVADGMGGHEAGEVASSMIADALEHIPAPMAMDELIASVERSLYSVNRKIREQSALHFNRRTIGSTVVILLTYINQGVCLWVGDSRAYRLRQGRLDQVTRDHSHVQELVDRGLIDSEDAENHPMANVITRAVGSTHDLRIDRINFELQAGDVFLLCSDGLNKTMSDAEIADILADGDSESTARQLIDIALERGANDNVTVIVVRITQQQADTMDFEDDATRPVHFDHDTTIPIEQMNLRRRNNH